MTAGFTEPKLFQMLRNEKAHFTIFGAGSIGSFFAAKLALAGNKVTAIAREEHARQIAAQGLTLHSCHGEIIHIPLEVKGKIDANMPLSQVIISTKAYDNEKACSEIRNVLDSQDIPQIKIILLQNGVGNEKPYEQIFLKQNIYRLLTTEAATLRRPGQVVHTGKGKSILVRRDSGSNGYERWLAEVLTSSGLQCQMSIDFEKSVWTKLLINVPINPLGAIYRVTNGQLLQQKKILHRFEKLVTESITILDAKPIKTAFKDPLEEIKDVARKTANNKSSMLRDLERGKLTEIDYINGAIIALANELGMHAKENIQAVRQVKALERQTRESRLSSSLGMDGAI